MILIENYNLIFLLGEVTV